MPKQSNNNHKQRALGWNRIDAPQCFSSYFLFLPTARPEAKAAGASKFLDCACCFPPALPFLVYLACPRTMTGLVTPAVWSRLAEFSSTSSSAVIPTMISLPGLPASLARYSRFNASFFIKCRTANDRNEEGTTQNVWVKVEVPKRSGCGVASASSPRTRLQPPQAVHCPVLLWGAPAC